jgi:cobalamin biosynthesis protein CbiD
VQHTTTAAAAAAAAAAAWSRSNSNLHETRRVRVRPFDLSEKFFVPGKKSPGDTQMTVLE